MKVMAYFFAKGWGKQVVTLGLVSLSGFRGQTRAVTFRGELDTVPAPLWWAKLVLPGTRLPPGDACVCISSPHPESRHCCPWCHFN